MYYDSEMSRCVAVVLLALFSLAMASCGGGDGGNTTSYTVIATAGSGGSINPASATVSSGAMASFTVTLDSGNSINTVAGCGGALVGSTYTTGAVTADCTVTASFVGNGQPTVSVADASVTEGDSGTTNLIFTVTLNALAGGNVDVDYATSDGGATVGDNDYTAVNGTLTILAGSTSGTVTVDVTGDTAVEGDETLTLTLSNPIGATLGTAAATGTINNDDSTPHPLPTISIANANVIEGNSGTTSLDFAVTLSSLTNGNVDVGYASTDGTATVADNDYASSSGTLTIPAGSTSATISVDILGDKYIENDETLVLTLNNPSANVKLGVATAVGSILNEDSPFLNDTGITACADSTTNGLACPQVGHPGQDAEYGRDVTANDDSDGHAGFSFIKLDSSGNPLTDQNVAYDTTPWYCVQDNVTGLMWEVKTTDGGLRDMNWAYTWYNSTGINDGDAPGTANGGTCVDSSNCDTEKYVTAVNATGLCGQSDWRLPTVDDLSSLVDGSVAVAQNFSTPIIDAEYFPNTSPSITWSSSPWSVGGGPWVVEFQTGNVTTRTNFSSYAVRLVREVQ